MNCFLLLAYAELSPKTPFTGRIEGGWEYIWFCYGLAWLTVLGYAFFLLRLRKHLPELPPETPQPETPQPEDKHL